MANNTYIRDIANRIRAKIKASDLPDRGLDELFDIYAVLTLAKGASVTNEDVHNAWSAWATQFDPDSSSLVPFNQLPEEVQQSDTIFTQAIRETATAFVR